MNAEEIRIGADFGCGPYGWRRSDANSLWSNFACVGSGLSEEIGTSRKLDADFAEWVISFERNYEDADFDWSAFHFQGIALSKRLKAEVGDRFIIYYCTPSEDPIRGHNSPMLIE
jgi:hypothetical protein